MIMIGFCGLTSTVSRPTLPIAEPHPFFRIAQIEQNAFKKLIRDNVWLDPALSSLVTISGSNQPRNELSILKQSFSF